MVQGARDLESGLSVYKTLLSNLIQIIKFIQKQRNYENNRVLKFDKLPPKVLY